MASTLKIFFAVTLSLSLVACTVIPIKINDEDPTVEEMQAKALAYNIWADHAIKNNPLELKVDDSGKYYVTNKVDFEGNSKIYEIESEFIFTTEKIYQTNFSDFIKELEKKHGYDEVTYFSIYLISEYFNPESKFKPLLDVLPKIQPTPAYDYWNRSKQIDEHLIGYSVLRKIVDYKVQLDARARNIYKGIILPNTEKFNPEHFNQENIEWALSVFDSQLQFSRFRSLVLPYINFFELSGVEGVGSTAVTTVDKEGNTFIINVDIFGNSKVATGSVMKRNPKMSGDNIMVYYGTTLDSNDANDCLSLGLTFSERKDDKLASERISFFSKFFLYDRNHYDLIEECIPLSKPFPRRILFYFYVLMMDKLDLEKSDPKRVHLDEDKIIVQFAADNLSGLNKLFKLTLEEEQNSQSIEDKAFVKHFKLYKIQQRQLLMKLIEIYYNRYHYLVKDESL